MRPSGPSSISELGSAVFSALMRQVCVLWMLWNWLKLWSILDMPSLFTPPWPYAEATHLSLVVTLLRAPGHAVGGREGGALWTERLAEGRSRGAGAGARGGRPWGVEDPL